jgi:hypothetical protein
LNGRVDAAAVERWPSLSGAKARDDGGFAVCDAVTRLRPDLAVILTSLDSYEHCGERLESCGARGFLRKAHLATFDLSRFQQPA